MTFQNHFLFQDFPEFSRTVGILQVPIDQTRYMGFYSFRMVHHPQWQMVVNINVGQKMDVIWQYYAPSPVYTNTIEFFI